ncbi:MAG: multiheme c-type cytochrome [Bacteroidota bacterium]|nr:multiheme c-type cytochrome [Bacteroidota bacterium]
MPTSFRKIRNTQTIPAALMIAVFFCANMCSSRQESDESGPIKDGYGKAFAGSAACISCHADLYKSHIQTAHYRDSRPASAATIKGSFDSRRNRYLFSSSTEVVMERKDTGFFQTALVNGKKFRSERFEIVIGSGRKGQTYLYYGDDGKLYQLPISYSTTTDGWCNSPGYYPDSIRFNRQVTAYCLECHATNAGSGPDAVYDQEIIDKSQILYGIDCERCHGPAAQHVNYQTAHPGDRHARYIINPALLPRQRRLDACALCHSGLGVALKPAFSFRAGDTLRNYYQPGLGKGTAVPEVHGNQYGLLLSSRCFIRSQIDCSSCHHVHAREVNDPKLFSQRCIACHNEAAHNTCTMHPTPGLVLSDNCIDCHMPALASQKIAIQGSGMSKELLSGASKATPALVRTHRIAIYPESTLQYLEKIKAKKS